MNCNNEKRESAINYLLIERMAKRLGCTAYGGGDFWEFYLNPKLFRSKHWKIAKFDGVSLLGYGCPETVTRIATEFREVLGKDLLVTWMSDKPVYDLHHSLYY